MLIKGEKYACDACVRGHRVSTCQHADRPLTHINKKGRPVSQCPHCRGLRKSRGSHASCECGVKTHTGDECHSLSLDGKNDSDAGSDAGDFHQAGCCCTHGLKCTCSLKNDHSLDSVPEIDRPIMPTLRRTSSKKPRATKAGSDSTLTVFANGHHKPVHKHNDSAHQAGLPYKIPIPHSISGNADVARRSTDSLPLMKRRDSPHVDLSNIQYDARLSRSEQNSPPPAALSQEQLFPFDMSTYLSPTEPLPADELPPSAFYSSAPDSQAFSPGIGTPNPEEWNNLNLSLDGVPSIYNRQSAVNSLENAGGLPTNSSSGDVSEISDYVSHPSASGNQRPELSLSTPGSEHRNENRYSTASLTSLERQDLPPPSLDLERSSLPPLTTASPSEVEESPGFGGRLQLLRPEAFEKHGFTVHDAQRWAHPETPTEAMNGLKMASQTSLVAHHSDEEEKKPHIWTDNASPGETTGYIGHDEEGEDEWD